MPKVSNSQQSGLPAFEANAVPQVLQNQQQQAYVLRCANEGIIESPKTLLTQRYADRISTIRRVPRSITPGEMFERIWSEDLNRSIVEAMNEDLEEQGKQRITVEMMRKYIAHYLYMCVVVCRNIVEHWRGGNKPEGAIAKHRWFHIHANREFPLLPLFARVTERTRYYLNIGSEVTTDELQTNYSGQSPVRNFNPSKPHAWGHLIYMTGVVVGGRTIIVAAKPRVPNYHRGHPQTHHVIEDLDLDLPQDQPIHYVCDSFYNTKGTREYLAAQPSRFYTMAGKTEWLPHVWRRLAHNLPHDEWAQLVSPGRHEIYTVYHSLKKVNTMSNAFDVAPLPPVVPALPPLYQVYRARFNLIDLFNRVYFSIQFPHKQLGWKTNFFDVVLKIAVINAWVLYNNSSGEPPLTIRDFIRDVAAYLFEDPQI